MNKVLKLKVRSHCLSTLGGIKMYILQNSIGLEGMSKCQWNKLSYVESTGVKLMEKYLCVCLLWWYCGFRIRMIKRFCKTLAEIFIYLSAEQWGSIASLLSRVRSFSNSILQVIPDCYDLPVMKAFLRVLIR